ncbi:alpha/beta fold hydrolase [Sphingosinicella sp. BN140058]|uniref:alpha/beta hydrolase n=1 Tax=Sphingosinicella sp. BN140058 TaxID=1892855 RepID=UPI0010102174|nr:alpha/beta fold hydrolase [Sphingosinicella sp. BN140058]QAY77360.1 DUF1749 domain-containing protein [Sphingosinicella sp. BN140058]
MMKIRTIAATLMIGALTGAAPASRPVIPSLPYVIDFERGAPLLTGGSPATPPRPGTVLPVADAAIADPPRDPGHPAANRQLLISSHGYEMNALFLLAGGAGPKPTLLLLHGLPGNERNLDLAQAVRRAGWNVLTFTYRGAWGSEGTFSIQHALEDTQVALAFLRTPETARRYQVDPTRLVVAGHSMGGFAAAWTAANDAVAGNRSARPGFADAAGPLAGLILLDAWDIGPSTAALRVGDAAAARAEFIAGFDDIGHSLGPITAADLADELARRGAQWQLAALAPRLSTSPMLSVYARHGGAAENKAFADTLRRRPGADVTAVELDSDHAFADKRIALTRAVVGWLETRGQVVSTWPGPAQVQARR